ncbi:hypothetical protein [Streptomyces sp. NPDC051546]
MNSKNRHSKTPQARHPARARREQVRAPAFSWDQAAVTGPLA